MNDDKDQLTAEIGEALDILKKRWQLKSRIEVIKHLIELSEPTTLQIAQRRLRLENEKKEE